MLKMKIKLRKTFGEYLNFYFKTLFFAKDGLEALEIYRKYRPDIIFLDIYIPKIDGLKVAKIIRDSDKYTRLIMLTAHTEVDILLRATEIDMSRYLVKPVSSKELKSALDKVAKELLELSPDTITLATNILYFKSKTQLIIDGKKLDLSNKEQKILNLLILNLNQTVSIEDIIVNSWENYYIENISKDSVKTQISYLRKKLPKNMTIKSIYGVGYSLKIF